MAIRAVTMKRFSQGGFVMDFLETVAFLAAQLLTLDIDEPAGLIILHMVTDTAARIRQRFGMNVMGEADRRSSQFAKNILVSQIVLGLLCHGIVKYG